MNDYFIFLRPARQVQANLSLDQHPLFPDRLLLSSMFISSFSLTYYTSEIPSHSITNDGDLASESENDKSFLNFTHKPMFYLDQKFFVKLISMINWLVIWINGSL